MAARALLSDAAIALNISSACPPLSSSVLHFFTYSGVFTVPSVRGGQKKTSISVSLPPGKRRQQGADRNRRGAIRGGGGEALRGLGSGGLDQRLERKVWQSLHTLSSGGFALPTL